MLVFKTMKIDENQKKQFSDGNIKLQKISENLSFGKNRLSFSQFCLSFGIAQFWDKCRKNKPALTAQKPFDVPEWHIIAKFTEPSQAISTVNILVLTSTPRCQKLDFVK